MKRFRILVLIFILWMIILFNIERPDFADGESIDFSSLLYVVAAGVTLVLVLIPDVAQIAFTKLLAPILAIYALLSVWRGFADPTLMGAFLTLGEVGSLALTVWLARMVTLSFLNMEVAIEDVVMDKASLNVLTMQEGEEQIRLELSRARRYDIEVALVHLHLTLLKELIITERSFLDEQSIFKRRFIQGQIAKHVEAVLHRGDIIAWYNDNLVICLPNHTREQAHMLVQDIYTRLSFRLGLNVSMGVAVFPHDGLTYENLVAEAAFRTTPFHDHNDNHPGGNGKVVSPFGDDFKLTMDELEELELDSLDSLGDEEMPSSNGEAIVRPVNRNSFAATALRSAKELITPSPILSAEIKNVFPTYQEAWYKEVAWLEQAHFQSSSAIAIYSRFKRAFDLFLVIITAPLTIPLAAILSLLIYLEDGKPIVFTQDRTGMGGRQFKLYKFRSMVPNAEEMLKDLAAQGLAVLDEDGKLAAPLKLDPDPRITRLGRFLRKTSLDELPQLLNVLKGEMSLVGPRPTSWDVESYQLFHTERLSVRPGITGLFQVYDRGSPDFNTWLKWDIKYVDKMSFYLDMRILFLTFALVMFKRNGAR